MGTLADRLRAEVGRLRAGERLPSSRTLVERHRVSPVTVSRALGLLAAEGLVVTRPGSGTFAAERPAPAPGGADLGWQSVALGERSVDAAGVTWLLTPAPDGVIPLSGGYLHPSLQPLRALAAAGARAARRPDAWETPPLNGLAGLRTWFARSAGGDLTASDVLITSGGQQALTSTLRALLRPGAPLLVESPTYLGVLAIARANGLQPVPVPADAEGVRPDLLAEAFAMTGARVFYCQPTFSNPSGARMPAERRAQVIAVARAAGAFVIEDDFARHLAIDTAPAAMINHDLDGRVVYVAPMTKATSASMRIAGVIARGPVAERIRAVQMVEGFFPARPLQETLLELVSSPGWPRHLRAVRTALKSRRDALCAALARHLPEVRYHRPSGGPHMWVRLPDGIDDVALAESALRAGVLVSAGRPFFPAEPPAPHLRLSFACATSEAEIAEGVRRLAGAIARARA
ncbi:PLP-dependent aminotransferase family protein [Spirillospora sp. NPDC047279]|uniref:aminotransferase-like domain-containing protein n=1 Tax=Spirillospora sp. NPDC047279 TaxID=3155478 RepID=UPI0033D79EE7